MSSKLIALWLTAVCLALVQQNASAHGGVVLEEDLCVINIGYFKAHFKIFQPRTRQHEEFCEDLPDAAESVFVMEYMHSGLGEVPIDFRIIKNVTGLGRFAKWEDVAQIENLDDITVLYQPPVVEPDVFSVVHHFDEPGEFIGIVTAEHPTAGKLYTAVFPFEAGFTGFGYWPWFAALVIVVQLHYWLVSGTFSRWRRRRSAPFATVSEL